MREYGSDCGARVASGWRSRVGQGSATRVAHLPADVGGDVRLAHVREGLHFDEAARCGLNSPFGPSREVVRGRGLGRTSVGDRTVCLWHLRPLPVAISAIIADIVQNTPRPGGGPVSAAPRPSHACEVEPARCRRAAARRAPPRLRLRILVPSGALPSKPPQARSASGPPACAMS